MSKFIEYKIPQRKGITDLRGQLPGHGATDWWTKEEWDEWERTLPIKKRWNQRYINCLKKSGKFGEEYNITIKMQYNPLFDAPQTFKDVAG